MMNNVDADEKLTYTIRNAGQGREMWFLTEDGLYEVLMQSRKPVANDQFIMLFYSSWTSNAKLPPL